MTDVTKEIWKVETYQREVVGRHARMEVVTDVSLTDDKLVFFYEQGGGDSPELMARATLAARAPTFYRLLEQVLQVGKVPADLEELIRINLHRAAPEKYPDPPRNVIERKNAWEKLSELPEDLF